MTLKCIQDCREHQGRQTREELQVNTLLLGRWRNSKVA